MKTVVLASRTPGEQAMLDERRRLDQDRLDEVWQGEYHVNAAHGGPHGYLDDELAAILRPRAKAAGLRLVSPINVGGPSDHRVPDRRLLRGEQVLVTWFPTAASVVEVASPDDESWLKFDFSAVHGVDEVVVVDGGADRVHWFALRNGSHEPVDRSDLLDLDVAVVQETIDRS